MIWSCISNIWCSGWKWGLIQLYASGIMIYHIINTSTLRHQYVNITSSTRQHYVINTSALRQHTCLAVGSRVARRAGAYISAATSDVACATVLTRIACAGVNWKIRKKQQAHSIIIILINVYCYFRKPLSSIDFSSAWKRIWQKCKNNVLQTSDTKDHRLEDAYKFVLTSKYWKVASIKKMKYSQVGVVAAAAHWVQVEDGG